MARKPTKAEAKRTKADKAYRARSLKKLLSEFKDFRRTMLPVDEMLHSTKMMRTIGAIRLKNGRLAAANVAVIRRLIALSESYMFNRSLVSDRVWRFAILDALTGLR